MNERWSYPIERVTLWAEANEARVLGIIGLEHGSGVSSLSHAVAEMFALSGDTALLVDLSRSVPDAAWKGSGLWQEAEQEERKYHVLLATPTRDNQFKFNNMARMEAAMQDGLSRYDRVVVDLPPLLHNHPNLLNPLAAAAACDLLLLVCLRGQVRRAQLSEGLSLLRAHRIDLSATVFNDHLYVSPGEGIAQLGRRISRFSPPLGRWIEAAGLSIGSLE